MITFIGLLRIKKGNPMYQMFSYDLAEAMRSTNHWIGATAKTVARSPFLAAVPNPMLAYIGAWGEVAERSFDCITHKPSWNIDEVASDCGTFHQVNIKSVVQKPFCNLLNFEAEGRAPMGRKVLLIAPMSGHYATLVRATVTSLLTDNDVYVTDWLNARDIPVSDGQFDVETYADYLVEFIQTLGADVHVVAICQPAPLALAATAYLNQTDPKSVPTSLTLIGGPIDPAAKETEVTKFSEKVTIAQLEQSMVQRVGYSYAGVGRRVYPGHLQLTSFIAMNWQTHSKAFSEQIFRAANGEASDDDKHNIFYDEYLAVMDMPAEFYLSTVDRIFKKREIAANTFVLNGVELDISAIENTAIMTIEGERDDISAPGQCAAALDLCPKLPTALKQAHVEPNAGHYGIFAGRRWRDNIRPKVIDFMDKAAKSRKAS